MDDRRMGLLVEVERGLQKWWFGEDLGMGLSRNSRIGYSRSALLVEGC